MHHSAVPGVGQRCFAAKAAAVRWPDILLPSLMPAAKRAAPGRCNARKGRGDTRRDDAGVLPSEAVQTAL